MESEPPNLVPLGTTVDRVTIIEAAVLESAEQLRIVTALESKDGATSPGGSARCGHRSM